MKHTLCGALILSGGLFLLMLFPLDAQDLSNPLPDTESETSKPFYPGRAWYYSTHFDVGFISELDTGAAGGEADFGFSFDDLGGIKGPELGFSGLLRYLKAQDEEPGINLGFGLEAAWRFDLFDLFSVKPLLGISLLGDLVALGEELGAAEDGSIDPESFLKAELSLGLELSMGLINYTRILLSPRFTLPFSEEASPAFYLSLGVKNLKPYKIPVKKAEPKTEASTLLFSPDDDGVDDVLSIKLNTEDRGVIQVWAVTISDDKDQVLRRFSGEGAPPFAIDWDGKTEQGDLVESATDLTVRFATTDVLGRSSETTQHLQVDILVIKDGDNYKIRLPNIEFPANSARLDSQRAQRFLDSNRKVLSRLAEIIAKFPNYAIVIEGHSNALHWQSPEAFKKEQESELIPLSASRAQAVKDALIILGVEGERMSILGMGASKPLVPFSSPDNWKNRRVEFILLK